MFRSSGILAVALSLGWAISVPAMAEEKGLSGGRIAADKGDLVIHPVNHVAFAMQWDGKPMEAPE